MLRTKLYPILARMEQLSPAWARPDRCTEPHVRKASLLAADLLHVLPSIPEVEPRWVHGFEEGRGARTARRGGGRSPQMHAVGRGWKMAGGWRRCLKLGSRENSPTDMMGPSKPMQRQAFAKLAEAIQEPLDASTKNHAGKDPRNPGHEEPTRATGSESGRRGTTGYAHPAPIPTPCRACSPPHLPGGRTWPTSSRMGSV